MSTGLMQVDCQDFLPKNLMQVVLTTCNKSANIKLHRIILTDLMKLDETNRLNATRCQTYIKPVKFTSCIKSVAFVLTSCKLLFVFCRRSYRRRSRWDGGEDVM